VRIRRKAPKPARSHPLYILGHAGAPPTPIELRSWFDLEYGGPLRVQDSDLPEADEGTLLASHGPWSAAIERLSATDAKHWRDQLGWDHLCAVQLLPTIGQPLYRIDQALHAARLARGLTLLSQGTAYDVFSEEYLNPSDWQDRRLEQFTVEEHVRVSQSESSRPGQEWFSTRGLRKFGLEELELFRPVGLSARPVIETLSNIAGLLVQHGQKLTVGSTLVLRELDLTITVLGHRTVQAGGLSFSVREISWTSTRA
jgi:hypothetical protein